jgi:hypothetical protein
VKEYVHKCTTSIIEIISLLINIDLSDLSNLSDFHTLGFNCNCGLSYFTHHSYYLSRFYKRSAKKNIWDPKAQISIFLIIDNSVLKVHFQTIPLFRQVFFCNIGYCKLCNNYFHFESQLNKEILTILDHFRLLFIFGQQYSAVRV